MITQLLLEIQFIGELDVFVLLFENILRRLLPLAAAFVVAAAAAYNIFHASVHSLHSMHPMPCYY